MKKCQKGTIRLFITTCLIAIVSCAFAQDTGIKFESGTSWPAIQAKAKTEQKFIFVDCYATWCGPCKWMAANVFTKKETGDYFNARFINVAVQMDQTAGDAQAVKDWYPDAKSLHDTYAVNAYPTYLIIDPNGKLVHRMEGASPDAQQFIKSVSDAMAGIDEYYSVVKDWQSHQTDSVYLLSAFKTAIGAGDNPNIKAIGEAYVESLHQPLTKDNIQLIFSSGQLIRNTSDTCFKFFVANAAEIGRIMQDQNYVVYALRDMISYDEFKAVTAGKPKIQIDWNIVKADLERKYPTLIPGGLVSYALETFNAYIGGDIDVYIKKNDPNTPDDWEAIRKIVQQKFTGFNTDYIFLYEKGYHYYKKQSWPECAAVAYEILKKYDNNGELDPGTTNDIAWDWVFEHCNDKKILQQAVKCMKAAMQKDTMSAARMDTYANLLYKTGDKTNAIQLENQAIKMAPQINRYDLEDLKSFKENLANMQKGLPTWPGETAANTTINN